MIKRILVLILFPLQLFGLVEDDFSDGNFNVNPVWSGDSLEFQINNGELQLNAPANTNESYLSTESIAIDNATWSFTFRFEENPSSSNQAKVYLVSDQANLEGDLNGYYVRIGNTTDEVSLYRQTGNTEVEIIDGLDDLLDYEPISLQVKVTRDDVGNWELLADTSLSQNYTSMGTTLDSNHRTSRYFGVLCGYTSTRSTLFYFDDFDITGTGEVDRMAPQLVSVLPISPNQLQISFDEGIDPDLNVSQFSLNQGIGSPSTYSLVGGNEIVLTFDQSFQLEGSYSLIINNVSDLFDNRFTSVTTSFIYYVVQPFDILITELMPDPSPSITIPEAEYVELFNRSAYDLNLNGYSLSDASGGLTFSNIDILSGERLIVTKEDDASRFTGFGNTYGHEDFPALNNTSDLVLLKDPSGRLIHGIEYTLDWYQNTQKDDGGWALEMIDPSLPCLGLTNWSASNNDRGGTPGEMNSVNATNEDRLPPQLISVFPIDNDTVEVVFNEYIVNEDIIDNSNFSIEGIAIDSILVVDELNTQIQIVLNNELQANTVYNLDLANLNDCEGNALSTSVPFAIPAPVEIGDLLINEILFNPRSGGADFIEIVNISDKILDVNQIKIANTFEGGMLQQVEAIGTLNYLLFPGNFYVFSEDNSNLIQEYQVAHPGFLIETELPSWNDDAGTAVILDTNGNRIDEFNYNTNLHYELYDDLNGISLERISLTAPTQSMSNWHSAAETAGFATPTSSNSQSRLTKSQGSLTLNPEVMSPDGDGYNDFLLLQYTFPEAGYTVNCNIYNKHGQPIKNLVQNKLMAVSGSIKWDGDTNDGNKAPIGIYVVLWEFFNLEGDVDVIKKAVVVGGKL